MGAGTAEWLSSARLARRNRGAHPDRYRVVRYETLARTVSEADICAFVNLCGFNEPLFYDMEYVARESVFKGKPSPGAFTFREPFPVP